MKTLFSSTELPEELDGFAGGMGYKSIWHISESELGFDSDYNVKGYISKAVKGAHYAEVMDGDGNSRYACGTYFELMEWVEATVREMCIGQEYNED
jgi:hypothetical protein